MTSVLINPKTKEELQFISDLLKKLGIESSKLTDEEKEDIGLTKAILKADRKKKVSKSEVMKKLSA